MEIRDEKTKEAFAKYIVEHPQERFWQAIRNFAGVGFVYISNELMSEDGLKDTFYIESDEKE